MRIWKSGLKCDFGIHLDENCNKLHYVRESRIRPFSRIESVTQDLLLWRSGLKYKSIKSICFHHEAKLGFAFENRLNKCCDPFRIQKKHVKGGHKISTDIAKTFLKKGIECVPGWQLCRNCYRKQHQILEKNNDSLEEEANITEIESDFMQDSLSGQLNGSLEAIGESPVKTYGMPKHRRLSYASAKFDKTARAIEHHISSAIGASGTEISLFSEEQSGSVGIEQKAKDLDQVMEDVKSQVAVTTFRKDATSDTSS